MAINKRLIKSNDEAAGGASFNTVLYTGNSSGQSVTGVGFQPDFTWIKNRSITQSHHLIDSVRGTSFSLNSNKIDAEVNIGSEFSSFDSDGFTLGSGTNINNIGNNYVAWCWKAGGAAVINTDGTITSQVSANTEAGFSVVSYTGNGQNLETIGHGLGKSLDFWVIKQRNSSSNGWNAYHSSLAQGYKLGLDSTGAASYQAFASSVVPPTSEVFSVKSTGAGWDNATGGNYIAYCFAEVAGFSKFGSYTGNGNPTGDIISTSVDGDAGFEPAFVMIKSATYPNNPDYHSWTIYDNKRNMTGSETTDPLFANRSYAEGIRGNGSAGAGVLDFEFLSNGFRSLENGYETNASGVTYIYMAFANQF